MPQIQTIAAEKVLGFRGQETIEVTVTDECGLAGEFRVPFGKSEGMFEAMYVAPDQAVKICNETLNQLLHGFDPENQRVLDNTMIQADATPQKKNFGGNAILGISIACSRLAAREQGIALYQHLGNIINKRVSTHGPFPRMLYNLVEGGVHAQNNLAFQEHLIIPKVNSLNQQIEILKSFSQAFMQYAKTLGWNKAYGYEGGWAGNITKDGVILFGQDAEYAVFEALDAVRTQNDFPVDFGLDVAANNIAKFEPSSYCDFYVKCAKDFPITYLEDGFAEQEQDEWWKMLYGKIHHTTLMVGDDLTVTNPRKMDAYIGKNMINAIIIKPDQVGTLSETFDAIEKAKQNNWRVIISHRSQETTDDYLADLAVAVKADFVKFGAFAQGERLAKYNRLLEIEQ
ncbi:MAG: hypothetical protein COV41_01115 [Candidatus Brennerbacteria bacterium CG11_big_fil_rev_8_21_14_0_20_43_10]|uniref:Enolase n=3 Tax=Candidatus Brenneribacteriota TaxID=1817902 RepID=A0A2M8C306_9BACT|nr:MAG: hypothetical protein AUJ43_01235 [Parcubacteria group bacterium CG1_02_44_31]PIP50527.1 MAG: hypothetical protein COX12_00920 [Candidatus Brennerbacteria bacterium CG23_combo_of_CG06-09_8_20_14_all_44_41]PIR26613.1 MAG: hypothetical protein COV41_01115 [Candidatus Brennerbacteria bacterium CG11_big_fil_rev_8_21_14_0_20_43_10]PIX29116.1 MAG: hypothetical protein COZ64_00950 [Candidatus Brennerbacteria bacterium CG_4_8_14_3_um_filter_43_14]PJA19796.1 MAG: hypothetical protein COX61_00275 